MRSIPFQKIRLLQVLGIVLFFLPIPTGALFGADTLNACSPAEVRLYLALARASELAYDDNQSDLEKTPSGCVALVREDAEGNLIIAFRGSMLRDRTPRHRFSDFGGENVRRTYRDWVATNLKQTAGFLPRQYVEAASVVEKFVRQHPVDRLVYITGHSKGGGATAYAFVAASVSADVSERQARRMRCVTFNAAVVREQNWRRLLRRLKGDAAAAEKEIPSGSILSLVMRDDPVSKIAASEERRYVKRVYMDSTTDLTPNEQHGIRVIIDELEKKTRR